MPPPNVKIKKAKLKEGLYLDVTYTEQFPDGKVTTNKACTAEAHIDLRNAFKAMAPHLAKLCQQYDTKGNLVDTIECRGISVKEEEEDTDGFVLSGHRLLSNGKALIMNTPFQKYNVGQDTYEDIAACIQDIENCVQEIELYVFDNKHAPEAQGKLFDNIPDADSTNDEEED